ncbi:hypothetical protein [Paractinoplanes rishiriensis]|uniref:hypothetical protein n=1 Tax=Paractinoplanes rishiriensis TaxID=1050105 RepID=UPI001943BCC7|nr:hypothetical protein [Actinoplanes rishiriensis]
MSTPRTPQRSTSIVDFDVTAVIDPKAHISKLTSIAREAAIPLAAAALAIADTVGRRNADL